MKKLLIILSVLFSVYGKAAVLDISGWQQKDGSGNKKPVVISGVAVGEVPFFTATPGTVDSRKIISTDINDSTATGRSLMTTTDASTARTALGLVLGVNVQPWDADLDDLADGTLTQSKVADTGTTQSGTQAVPTTTSPLSPTWTTQDYIVYYGTTGTINLPLVSGYTKKTFYVFSTGTNTITVDPNGSETIIENGSSLGAGVADIISGTAGMLTGYLCDGVSWNKLNTGGGVASVTPLVENLDAAGYNISNAGTISATTFSGSASGLTAIPAPNLTGTIPDSTVENLTTSRNNIITPVAAVSNVIVTDNGQTNITLTGTTATLTYSTPPPTGAWFRYAVTAFTSDCLVTVPSTWSFTVGGNRTSYTVRANKNAYIVCHYTGTGYEMWGDPIEIGDLSHDTTPLTTSKIEVDQGAGGEYSTISEILTAGGALVSGGAAGTPSSINLSNATNFPYATGGTGTLGVANGGTGQTTIQAAMNALAAASGASVQGDILYYNGTNWVKLAASTSGYRLTTNGAGTNPTWAAPIEQYGIACSDETTAITFGTGKATFRVPHAMTLTAVRASVTTAPTGSTILIDINEGGTTVLSTKLMIDASEKTSTTATTAYVISDTALADDAEITIDFDQVGSSVAGAGVKVWLIGTR